MAFEKYSIPLMLCPPSSIIIGSLFIISNLPANLQVANPFSIEFSVILYPDCFTNSKAQRAVTAL